MGSDAEIEGSEKGVVRERFEVQVFCIETLLAAYKGGEEGDEEEDGMQKDHFGVQLCLLRVRLHRSTFERQRRNS